MFKEITGLQLKIKPRGPPVRDMPRHKLEVIKLLITAKEPVKTLSLNVLGHFQNLSHEGPTYNLGLVYRLYLSIYIKEYFVFTVGFF